MVNSKTFELDYTIESAGIWGLSKVELWGTTDEGRTWRSFTVDADNRSPLQATVDAEGLYGFRIEVQRNGDATALAPQSGQQPEVWVLVDLTPPTLKLERIEQGAGAQADELTVTWQASDASLAPRPIALAYSPSPAGPWTEIASELENTGKHTWRLDQQTPERFYFRITASDLAGNVGTFDTPQALRVEGVRPRGRIQGVRPLGTAGRSRVINNPY
ncbi:MAG: hypothetical protein HY000_39200 [Planctomycetes bacterium]|nr:hypothetical protein [Planctomycetota bacterium]